MNEEQKTHLAIVTEIGTFGSMGIKDQSVTNVDDIRQLAEETTGPSLKAYLESQVHN